MKFWCIYTGLIFMLIGHRSLSQTDSLPQNPAELIENVLEDFIQNLEEESDFDFNALLDNLEAYTVRPLDLNQADRIELENFGLLNALQINQFLLYRTTYGQLISIYELQAIPGFDIVTIRRMLPFVKVGVAGKSLKTRFKNLFTEGRHELLTRWTRILETQKGYQSQNEFPPAYLGSPDGLYLRYRLSLGNQMSLGFTAEKDRGEEFFKGSNRQGFDFYSAHFSIREVTPFVKQIILGDYAPKFGQGLILNSGFAPGKSSEVMAISRIGTPLRPYSSLNETDFFRGLATTLGIGKKLELTALLSFKKIDANIIDIDTTDQTGTEDEAFSSFLLSGYHRTDAEIADEKTLNQFVAGINSKYQSGSLKLSLNALHTRFNRELEKSIELYRLYRFSGKHLSTGSIDYQWFYRNLLFMGEVAMSDNGAVATTNGLQIGLGKRTRAAIAHRHFSKRFQSLFGQPFAETSGAQNESGLYSGLEIQATKSIRISTYYDQWNHPWLRFNVDAPSNGREWLVKVNYTIRRKMDFYVQIRQETKERNAPDNATKVDYLVPLERTYLRLHLTQKLSTTWESRSRLEWSIYDNSIVSPSKGLLIYQDLIFKPDNLPFSAAARLAYFDTDDYDSRLYAFENDVYYSFSIPAYYGSGIRTYLNLKWKIHSGVTAEGRIAQTFRNDSKEIGSGNDLIAGNTRTEVKAQIRWQF